VISAVDFHDDFYGWRHEVSDVPAQDHHLSAKQDPELAMVELGPQRGLGRIQLAAHLCGALGE
jgi:hypothetical protein